MENVRITMSNWKTAKRMMLLLPILASLSFGILCAFLLKTSSFGQYQVTPFSESTLGFVGSFANAFYFVLLAGVGATVLYVLLKRNRHRLVLAITGFALTAALFMLSIVYLYAILSEFPIQYVGALVLGVSILVTAAADYAIFKGKRFSGLAVLGIGGALGTFLGFALPTASTVLILILLAVYDAYAVYRGAVGKIAQDGLDQLRGLSFSFKDVQMGLGDLTFYSMLSGHMLLNFGLASCLASLAGILIGCLVSFRMVEKRGVFPGLPFPIFFGLAAGFMALLLVP
jgi:presenilin-like A22 family membrane protease